MSDDHQHDQSIAASNQQSSSIPTSAELHGIRLTDLCQKDKLDLLDPPSQLEIGKTSSDDKVSQARMQQPFDWNI